MGGPGSGRRPGGAGKKIIMANGKVHKVSKKSASNIATVNKRIAKRQAKISKK